MAVPVSEARETSLFVYRLAASPHAIQSALRALHQGLRLRAREARREDVPANWDDRRESHGKPQMSSRIVAARWDPAIQRLACSGCAGMFSDKSNRSQYCANALSTSFAEEPNCDKSYRWLADCLVAWLAMRPRIRCSASRGNDHPK